MEETSYLETSNRSIPEENSVDEPQAEEITSTMGNMNSCDIDEMRNVRNKVQLKKPKILQLVSENISSELCSG